MWQELFPLANVFGKGEGGRGMTSLSRKPLHLMWTLQVSCFLETFHLLLRKKRRWGRREREWPDLDRCNEYWPISIWSTVHLQQKLCEGEGTSVLPSFLFCPLGLITSCFKALLTYLERKISTYKLQLAFKWTHLGFVSLWSRSWEDFHLNPNDTFPPLTLVWFFWAWY